MRGQCRCDHFELQTTAPWSPISVEKNNNRYMYEEVEAGSDPYPTPQLVKETR